MAVATFVYQHTARLRVAVLLAKRKPLRLDLTVTGVKLMDVNIGSMISAKPGVVGGAPCIDGTRVPVRSIALYYKQGHLPEEIVQQYEHLSIAQIYAALAYYHANRAEVEADIAREEAEYDRLANEYEPLRQNA